MSQQMAGMVAGSIMKGSPALAGSICLCALPALIISTTFMGLYFSLLVKGTDYDDAFT